MNTWKQVRAILVLPGIVAVAIPAAILYRTAVAWPPSPWNIAIGTVLVILGIALMVWTNRLYHAAVSSRS